MTLLVLELKVPELAKSVAARDVWHSLIALAPTLFSFMITFLLAAVFWRMHALVLEWLRDVSGVVLVLNLAFLLFVSLLPFTTAMLGHFMRNSAAQTLYFLNQFALGGLLLLQWKTAVRKGLLREGAPVRSLDINARLIAFPLGAAAAVVVANINTQWSFTAFMLVVLIIRARRLRMERAAKR